MTKLSLLGDFGYWKKWVKAQKNPKVSLVMFVMFMVPLLSAPCIVWRTIMIIELLLLSLFQGYLSCDFEFGMSIMCHPSPSTILSHPASCTVIDHQSFQFSWFSIIHHHFLSLHSFVIMDHQQWLSLLTISIIYDQHGFPSFEHVCVNFPTPRCAMFPWTVFPWLSHVAIVAVAVKTWRSCCHFLLPQKLIEPSNGGIWTCIARVFGPQNGQSWGIGKLKHQHLQIPIKLASVPGMSIHEHLLLLG